jgi:integrase/recombinase XerD
VTRAGAKGGPATQTQAKFREQFGKYLEQQGLREGTVKQYVGRGAAILRARQTPADWLNTKVGKGAPRGTVLGYRSAAQHMHRFLLMVKPAIAGVMPSVDMKRVVKKRQLKLNNSLDPERLKLYVDAVLADKLISPEARSILLLLPFTGLRISEACALRPSHLIKQGNVRCIHVTDGKGNKERFVPMGKRAKQVIDHYRLKHRVQGPWLYPSPMTPAQAITPNNVRVHHRRIRRALGPDWEKMRVHDLRHTFASLLIERGVPLSAVKDLLGHASVQTTEIYIHSNASALKKYVDQL